MLLTVLTMNEVNNIISEHFIKIFGNVVEHYPAAAIGILKNRPFKNPTDISKAFSKYLDDLCFNEKHKVLELYPDLVSKLADLSKIILEFDQNSRIQDADKLSFDDKKKLNLLNRRYKEKFGFPFIIYGKENNISKVFSSMETRIENDQDYEVTIAIEEVKKICELRIYEILQLQPR